MTEEDQAKHSEGDAVKQFSDFISARDKLVNAFISKRVTDLSLTESEIGALLHVLKKAGSGKGL